MRTLFGKLAIVLAGGLIFVGCSSDGPSFTPPEEPDAVETGVVRFVHAVADAPDVDVLQTVATIVRGLGFKESTPEISVATGTLPVQVDALLPGGQATVIGPVDLTIEADTAYSVIAAGDVTSIAPLVVSRSAASIAADSVRAQVVHAAPSAPAVDVYVTAPSAMLDQSVPLGSFAFGDSLGPVEFPAGDYRIRVTAADDVSAVVFDSGTVGLPGGTDLLVVAVQNTTTGESPISLLAVADDAYFEILDAETPAEVRVVHASPDAPSVDVIVNDDFSNPLLSGVPYPAFSDYLEVPAGTYNLKVTPEGNAGVIVIDADVELEPARQYSVYAVGPLASIAPLVTIDDDRSIGTQAKLRALHLAPSAGLVDLYVTASGEDIAELEPALSNVDFLADTGYLSLAGGTYDVTVTAAGTKSAAIGPATLTIADGGVYTVAARDAAGGGAPFGVILLDDFAP